MKILSLSTCPLDPTLGSGKTRLRWTSGLRELGHSVEVAEPGDFEMWFGTKRGLRFRQAYGAVRFVKEKIQAAEYDLIECFGGEFGLMTRQISKLRKRPLIVAHTDGLELLATDRQRAFDPPRSFPASVKGWYSRQTHDRLSRAAFTHADAFVAGCDADRKYVLDQGLFPEHRAATVEPGVDPEFLSIPFSPNKEHTVAFTGTWIARKGVGTLAAIMSRILTSQPSVRLVLYGTGTSSQVVLNSFPEEIRNRLVAHSPVTNQQMADGLAKASIFFFPTQYEGFGMALAEAMACGCAPVTTPTGFGATLRDGEEAIICDFTDTAGMENAILSLLRDENLRVRIARNAWERVRGLTWEANVAKLEALYLEWTSEHRARVAATDGQTHDAWAGRYSKA